VVTEALANNTWADSAAFFGTTRTYGSNTISNYVTDAFSESAFETAYQTMASYLGHKDQPLGVMPFALVHGPSLRDEVFDVLTNDFRATAATNGVAVRNRNKGLVTPVMSTRLVGANAAKWFLLGEVAGIRAMCWQERVAPELQDSRLSPDSDFVFENDKYQVGTRQRGKAFMALPHLAYFGNA